MYYNKAVMHTCFKYWQLLIILRQMVPHIHTHKYTFFVLTNTYFNLYTRTYKHTF